MKALLVLILVAVLVTGCGIFKVNSVTDVAARMAGRRAGYELAGRTGVVDGTIYILCERILEADGDELKVLLEQLQAVLVSRMEVIDDPMTVADIEDLMAIVEANEGATPQLNVPAIKSAIGGFMEGVCFAWGDSYEKCK